jgi:hypothetical protein
MVLMDDVRGFRDQRTALVARSSPEALQFLDELKGAPIDHLWLDHDLVGTDTVDPVVHLHIHLARKQGPHRTWDKLTFRHQHQRGSPDGRRAACARLPCRSQ